MFFSFSLKLHSISLPPFFLPLSSLSYAQLQQKLRTHAHFLFGTSAHLFHTLTHTDTHGHSILSRTPSPSPTVSLWKQTISAKPSCAHYTHTHARKNAQYAHFYPPATLPLQPSSTLFQKFPFSVLALTTKAFEYKNIRERVKAEVRKLEKAWREKKSNVRKKLFSPKLDLSIGGLEAPLIAKWSGVMGIGDWPSWNLTSIDAK